MKDIVSEFDVDAWWAEWVEALEATQFEEIGAPSSEWLTW